MLLARNTLSVALLLALTVNASRVVAQGLPVLRVEHAAAVAPEPFSIIKGLRELSDGRVMVTDWIEERLIVIDFERGTLEDIGRVGGGPVEFRLPDRLVALPADTTLLVDQGNGRLIVISPELAFVRTIPVHAHRERYPMHPRGADQRGILYFQPSPFAVGRSGPSDSVPIGRWREGGDGVALVGGGVRLKAYTPRPSGPRDRRSRLDRARSRDTGRSPPRSARLSARRVDVRPW